MDINSAVGRKSGLSDEQLLALGDFENSDAFNEIEKNVLRLATQMTGTPANVPEALFVSLRQQFSDEQRVELASACAWENYRARFNRVFDVDSQNFSQGGVCVVHVGRTAQDFLWGPACWRAASVPRRVGKTSELSSAGFSCLIFQSPSRNIPRIVRQS